MALTIEDLLTSPDHYFHSFEDDGAVFVPMDRAAYQRSIFLDRRISPAADGAMTVPLSILPGEGLPAQRMGWIFHVAHCGSTLLARGLDALAGDQAIVLREPLALRQLGFDPDPARLSLALALLGKRYPGAGPSLIKENVPVNFLLDDIAGHDSQAPAIFLTMGLADYLHAILRSDNHRTWMRGIVGRFAVQLGLDGPLTDGQAGAALWLGMMQRFVKAMARMPNARSLDAEVFFADPAGTLAASARHFGLTAGESAVGDLVAGPLFNTYSKRPDHAFDNRDRLERRRMLSASLAGEIAEARDWLGQRGVDEAVLEADIAGAALLTA